MWKPIKYTQYNFPAFVDMLPKFEWKFSACFCPYSYSLFLSLFTDLKEFADLHLCMLRWRQQLSSLSFWIIRRMWNICRCLFKSSSPQIIIIIISRISSLFLFIFWVVIRKNDEPYLWNINYMKRKHIKRWELFFIYFSFFI